MSVRRTGDWRKARRILGGLPMRLKIALDRALKQEAQLLRKMIVQGITKQAPGGDAFEPLSPLTLAARELAGFGGSKALIVRADLRNSVVAKVIGREAFVGVPRTAHGSDGASLVQVAEVQEFGTDPIIIPMTDAMRGYLGALLDQAGEPRRSGGGGDVVVTQIPPRPFLRPAFREWSKGVRPRMMARVARVMGGMS